MKVDHEATGLAAAIRAMTEANQQVVAQQRPAIEVGTVIEATVVETVAEPVEPKRQGRPLKAKVVGE